VQAVFFEAVVIAHSAFGISQQKIMRNLLSVADLLVRLTYS